MRVMKRKRDKNSRMLIKSKARDEGVDQLAADIANYGAEYYSSLRKGRNPLGGVNSPYEVDKNYRMYGTGPMGEKTIKPVLRYKRKGIRKWAGERGERERKKGMPEYGR